MSLARLAALLLVAAQLIVVGSAEAKQGDNAVLFTTVRFSGRSPIHVYLVDRRAFSVPFTGLRHLVLRPTKKQIDRGHLDVRIEGLRPGRYGLRCFQDENRNGKLDRGLFGPSEPWGMSFRGNRPWGRPTFGAIAFDVKAGRRNHVRVVVR